MKVAITFIGTNKYLDFYQDTMKTLKNIFYLTPKRFFGIHGW